MSEAKVGKELCIYRRKGTACERVVWNNDNFKVTSQCPILEGNHSQPHPSRACIAKCNVRTVSDRWQKCWKGLNQP
jgi:hypothetical protein